MQDFAIFDSVDYANAAASERERAMNATRQSLEYRRLAADAHGARETSLFRKLLAGPSACGHASREPAASAGWSSWV